MKVRYCGALFPLALLGLIPLVFSSCGGVTEQAKVATAIQTIMANTILGFAGKSDTTSTSFTFNCGDGSGNQGTMAYAGVTEPNPAQLLSDIQAGSPVPFATLTFTQCVVSACGSSFIISGGSASLQMGVQNLATTIETGAIPAAFSLVVTNQTVSGFVSGTVSYSYEIEANYTTSPELSINSINIVDPPTPNPMVIDGNTYPSDQINALSNGC